MGKETILQAKLGVKFSPCPFIIFNLLTYHACRTQSCVHTTSSLCPNIQPWKSSCVQNSTTGFMENYLSIQLSSIRSHYGFYLKPLWKWPFISRDKLSEQCFIDRNTPVLFDGNPARDKHFSFARH